LFCHVQISHTMEPHVVFLLSLESSWRVRVHWLGLRFFGPMVWKLLIIEPFSQWKLNKIETEKSIGIWKLSSCCWRALGESDLIEFISKVSELKCEKYCFLSGFCCWKFKQIAKIGFERKNQLSPRCVHTWANGTGYTKSLLLYHSKEQTWGQTRYSYLFICIVLTTRILMLSFLKGEKCVLSHKYSPNFPVQICYVDIFFDNFVLQEPFSDKCVGGFGIHPWKIS